MLTREQIADYARRAGFPEAAINTMVAIALAESRGNPEAHCFNCVPGVQEDSRGLWQINVRAHPEYASQNLSDPLTNAKAALDISRGGTKFTPWTTFTSGAYKKYLAGEAAVVGAATSAINTFTGSFSPKPVSKETTRIIIYGTTTLLAFFVLLNLWKGK